MERHGKQRHHPAEQKRINPIAQFNPIHQLTMDQPTPPPQTQNPQQQNAPDPNVGANHDSPTGPTPPPVEQTPTPHPSEVGTKSHKKLIILVVIILLLAISAGGAFTYLKYYPKTPTTPSETFPTPSPPTEPSPTPDPTAD